MEKLKYTPEEIITQIKGSLVQLKSLVNSELSVKPSVTQDKIDGINSYFPHIESELDALKNDLPK